MAIVKAKLKKLPPTHFGKHTGTPIVAVYQKARSRAFDRGLPFSKKWNRDFNQFRIHLKNLGWKSGDCVMLQDEALGYVRGNIVLKSMSEVKKTNAGERVEFQGEEYLSLTALWERMAAPMVSYQMFMRRWHAGWPLEKALTSSQLDKDAEKGTMSRKVVTAKLTAACLMHLVQKGYGCFRELALGSRRKMRRRADVIGVHMKGDIILCEVKSSIEDFRVDKKFQLYLPYCHRMYFVFPYTIPWQKLLPEFQHLGIGVMELQRDGLIRMVRPAKRRDIDKKIERELLLRMVWRGSSISQRTSRKYPYRTYVEDLVRK